MGGATQGFLSHCRALTCELSIPTALVTMAMVGTTTMTPLPRRWSTSATMCPPREYTVWTGPSRHTPLGGTERRTSYNVQDKVLCIIGSEYIHNTLNMWGEGGHGTVIASLMSEYCHSLPLACLGLHHCCPRQRRAPPPHLACHQSVMKLGCGAACWGSPGRGWWGGDGGMG